MAQDIEEAGWASYLSDRRSFRDSQRERPAPHVDLETIREEQLIRSARIGAATAEICSHPAHLIRVDGSETYEAEGNDPAETLEFVTCLCCTASFSRSLIGGAA